MKGLHTFRLYGAKALDIQKISYLYTQIKSTLMKTLTRLFALCALVISVSSCATIFTATKYQVAFNTTPEGAGITIENREGKVIFEGTTPTTVKLKSSAGYMKKEEYKITFTKDGYAQKVVHISAELDGWYIGNILLGGLPGMLIVDPLSGAMYKIAKEDREINETLQPTKDVALQVYDINNLPDNISKEDLVRIS